MIRNYFADLEIEPTLDLERVKAAYRKLAKKYHPDVNGQSEMAANLFRRTQEAFERLDSEEKLKHHKQQLDKESDIFLEIEVSESAWDEGVAVLIPVERLSACPQCAGRSVVKAYASLCTKCAGRGTTEIRRGANRWTHSCEACDGVGRQRVSECGRCQGVGHIREIENIHVNLHDFDEGSMQLILPKQGHFSADKKVRGSLILRAKIRGL